MSSSQFNVAVADVERSEQHRTWDVPIAWLSTALAGTEAAPTERAGRLTVSVLKNGRQFLIRGKISVQVQLPCARTLDPAIYDLSPELFLMLNRELGDDGPRRARHRHKPKENEEADALTEEDAAFDTFLGDIIHLDDFVREQILLELPMVPLRSDLRLDPSPAIGAPPENPANGWAVDPRLAPLQQLAERMRAASSGSSPEDEAGKPSPNPSAKKK